MDMEGLTVGGDKPQMDFNASCVSVLSEGFLDPLDNALSDEGSVASSFSDMDSIAENEELDGRETTSMLGLDSDFSDSESEAESDDDEGKSESDAEDEEQAQVAEPETEPTSREPRRKRGFLSRMASNDSLFGGGRGAPPRKPDSTTAPPRRGFLARMASNDSLFGGGRAPRKPASEKPNRRSFLARMGSSDSLFGGMPMRFGAGRQDSHKPHGSKTRRGGRRNRGGTKKPEEDTDEPTRGVNRMNTDDSLVPGPIRAVRRTSTQDSLDPASGDGKLMPKPTRTRRGGRRNRDGGGANTTPEGGPQRGVFRNNTSDSLVQSSRPPRRGGRRKSSTSKSVDVEKSPVADAPTEGESCSESSTLLEMATMVQT